MKCIAEDAVPEYAFNDERAGNSALLLRILNTNIRISNHQPNNT